MRSALSACVTALLSVAAVAAPLPTFTPAPTGGGNVFSGEPYQITACFNNASPSDPGYSPTIQVVVPAGSTLNSASYLGNAQTVQTIGTCNLAGGCPTGFVSPDTGLAVPLQLNETLAIVRYSLGSFSPTQPPACAVMSFALGNTSVAPLDTPRNVQLTPIFALGADPLDDPGTDPAVAGSTVPVPVTPKLIKLTKTILAPESETATGPNYPRTVKISVQVANGATITNADVSDVLPGTLQFIPGTVTFTGCAGTVTDLGTPTGATPGGTITRRCSSVTGNGSPGTLVLSFQVFVPNLDAGSVPIVTPAAPVKVITNGASVNALFGANPVSASDTTTIAAKLLTTRKSVADLVDLGNNGPSSGDTLEYSVIVDLSDFWSVALGGAGSLTVVDTLGDGQTFLGCSDASTTLSAQMNGVSYPVQPAAANCTASAKDPVTGKTTITLDVGSAISALFGPTWFGDLSNDAIQQGASTLTLKFRTTIDVSYSANPFAGGGTPVLSLGDSVGNGVVTSGVASGQPVSDPSSASVTIVNATFVKSIYAFNNVSPPPPNFRIGPGDLVTYRITETIPIASFENAKITDYLPLPFFNASTFIPAGDASIANSGTVPAPDRWTTGPLDDFTSLGTVKNVSPTASSNTVANSVEWDYGTYDGQDANKTIDLLFTVRATTKPFADSLAVSNVVLGFYNNSTGVISSTAAATNGTTRAPKLTLAKSIIASSHTSAPACTTATPPANYDAAYAGCDSGDTIDYRLTVSNIGHFDAYNVLLDDDGGLAAAGYGGSCTLLGVSDGAGTAIATTGNLFDTSAGNGLLIATIPADNNGTLDPNEIARIDYRCTIQQNALPSLPTLAIDNTARLKYYAASPLETNDPLFNYASNQSFPGPNVRKARVSITTLSIAKVISASSVAGTVSPIINFGETLTYTITVALSEGTFQNFSLTDNQTVIPSPVTCGSNGFVCSANVLVAGTTVTVSATPDSTPGTIAYTYSAQRTASGTNTASVSATNAPVQVASASWTLGSPNAIVSKAFNPTTADAGDTVQIGLGWNNSNAANPMFQCVITDNLNIAFFDPSTITALTTPAGYAFAADTVTGVVIYTATDLTTPCPTVAALGATFNVNLRANDTTGGNVGNTASLLGNTLPSPQTPGAPVTGSASANLSLSAPTSAKTITATSEPDTAATPTTGNIAIGEVVTYHVTFTVPDGVTKALRLVDFMQGGLANFGYIAGSAKLSRSTTGLSSATNPGNINSTPAGTYVAVTPTCIGTSPCPTDEIWLDLGDVTDSDLGAGTTETYILELQLQALNVAANVGAATRVNQGRILYKPAGGADQYVNGGTVTNTVVVPIVHLDKKVLPALVAGGDQVTYTLTISNTSSGAGAASAYDWTFADTLPADLISPALVTPLASGVSASFTGNVLSGKIAKLDPGTQAQVQYTATILSTTPIGKTIVNAANTQATSLPGPNGTLNATPGAAGSCNGERTGNGGDNVICNGVSNSNNLTFAATAPFTTNSINVAKALIAPQSYYAIGDIVQYQVQISVPVGTATTVRLQDTLPAGLAFNPGSATISNTAGITYTGTPTPPSIAGQVLTFPLGNVTATAAGTITIRYNATVSNVLTNQDNTGLVNNAQVLFDNPSTPGTLTITAPSPPSVRVGEPNLTDTKQITAGAVNADAGDNIDFKVVISNGGNTTAYQLDVRDVMPNGLFQITNVAIATTGSVVLNGTAIPVVSSMAHVKTTTNINDTIDIADTGLGDAASTIAMPPGASLTLTFRAVVMNNVVPGQVLTNSIYTPYVSQVNCGTPGVVCRDASSAPVVDDDNDAVLNNYAESANIGLTIRSNIAIDKQVSPMVAPVGGTVTFTNRVALIEGVTPSVVFTDVLPPGLTYVSHTISVGHVGMTIANPFYATRIGTGQTVSFNFGDIGNPANGSNADDFVEIDIVARVDNVAANQNAVQLSNGQQSVGSLVTVTFGATPVTVTFDSDPATPGIQGRAMTVIEPVLKITKNVVPTTQALGDVVTYSLTIAHDATSTSDAFDIAMVDTLPAGITFVAGSVSPPGAFAGIVGQALSLNVGTLTQAAGSMTITYQARINNSAVVGAPLVNSVAGVWGSIPGATGAPDNGRNGTTLPASLNDYRTTASASLTPNANAFISAQKTVAIAIDADTSGNLTPGDTLEYTVTLKNTGSVVSNAVFTDPIPANTTFVQGSTTTTRGTIVEAPTLLTVNVGGMATNDVVTIKFRVIVNAGTPAGTVISNQGSVDTDQTVPTPTDADGIPANGAQPTDIVVGGPSTPASALYAEKYVALRTDTDASGTVTQGDVLRYTIILNNTGAASLSNVSFADVIPTGLSYVPASAVATAGTIAVIGANVAWSGIGTLAPGAVVSATFDVTITSVAGTSQTYVNQGTATSTQTGGVLTDSNGNPGDGNQPTTITAVGGGGTATPVLDVQKRWSLAIDTPPTGVPSPGDTLLYTITIANNGSAAATNVHLTDPVPSCTGALNPCTSFVAGSLVTSQGAIVSTAPIDVNVGTLPSGATATVSYEVLVSAATADGVVIANQAAVTRAGSASPVPSDDNGNPGDGLNPTLTPISATPSGGVPNNLSKSLQGTSEPDPFSTGSTVLVGEVARFRVAIGVPAGTTRQVTLRDILPAGLAYLPGSARLTRVFDTGLVASANPGNINGASSGVPIALSDGAGMIVGAGPGGTTTLAVFLGDVINSDNDANAEQYALEYRAVTQNVAGNQAGTTLNNAATVSYWNALSQTQTLTPVSTMLNVAEPVVTMNKSVNPAALLSTGGTTSFSITVANAAGAAPAFDVVIADPLPAAFTSVGPRTITAVNASGAVDTTSGTTVSAAIARIDAGGSVTITFSATAPGPLAIAPIPNTANATWTSLPGSNGSAADGAATPGTPGSATGERTGSGGVDDYAASASATVQVGGTNITKSIVGAKPRYAIGDPIGYQVDVAIPGNAFGALGNVVVADVLGAGLTYVPGSLVIAYNGASSSTNPVDFSRTDNAPAPGLETLTLALGTVSNAAAGATTIRLTYQAIVDDLLSNQTNVSLGNSVTLSFSDPGAGGATATRGPATTLVTIGEPFLALTKTLTSPAAGLQAGSTASFSVVAANTGTTTAFETVISDALPAGLFFPGGSIVTIVPNNVSGQLEIPTATVTAGGWQSSPFDLPVGDSVTFTFTATLANAVQPGQTLQNGVTGAYTSRNGVDANERTGASPGSDQSDDTKLDNYNTSALAAAITVADPIALDKTFSPNPAQNRYAVGQLVSYRIKVSLVEGTTQSVKVKDVLPVGLSYVTSGAPGTAPGTPITFSYPGSPTVAGQQITFDLGNVVDLPNGIASDDFITIDVTAHVDNVIANQDGTALGNNVSVSFTAPGGATVVRDFDADSGTPGVQPLNLTVIEPVLTLSKSANPLSVSLGDEVSFSVLIDHSPASHADAYDVTVVDTLPAGLSYVPGSASIAPAVSGQTLTFVVGTLTLVTDNTTLTYRARVASNAAVGVPLNNNAVLTYGSIPGATGAPASGRNGTGGIDDYSTASSAAVTPNANAQIRADKTVAMVVDADGSGNLTPGDTVEWTIVLTNNGPAVTNVVFSDTVPGSTSYVVGSLTTTKGIATAAPPSLSIAVGPMAASETVTIKFRTTVNVNVSAGTLLSNQGSVDSDQTIPTTTDGDGNPGNGNQPTTILVNGVPALTVVKAESFPADTNLDGQLNPGETIRYVLTVTSSGTSQASNVVFSDPVPAHTTVLTVTSNIGTVSGTTPPTVSLGTMLPGATATITIDVRVDTATLPGTLIVNQGSVSGLGIAPVGSNIVTATVAGFPVLKPPSGSKTVAFFGPNILEWRMVWINSANAFPLAVRVRDPMPAGVTYVPGSLICAPQGSSILTSCSFDGLSKSVVVESTLGPDNGHRDEGAAANELIITFRTTLDTNAAVVNVAVAYWDANGDGTVTDDVAAGQVPLGAMAQFGFGVVPIDSRWMLVLMASLLAMAGVRRLRKKT
jgi:uncharacterized repeat protein (TIGR01451 family)/fimbrial isopeptide formation D2 family protein